MNIFDYAMQMEKESENYYLNLAKQSKSKGMATIFNMLAVEEAKHNRMLGEMKTKTDIKFGNTNLLSDAKAVFAKMADNEKLDFSFEQLDVYRKAQEIETKSKKYYAQKADEVEDNYQKSVFTKLAKEEDKHYFLLENIIDFVSRPETWLENAEWHHLEEY
jgi:rubrerythrin